MRFARALWGFLLLLALQSTNSTLEAQVSQLVVDINGAPANSNPSAPVQAGSKLYFAATTEQGRELWVMDSAVSSPRLVLDIIPGSEGSAPSSLTAVGILLYFVATDEIHGRELWVTDGSSGGTRMVNDYTPGPISTFTSSEVLVGLSDQLILGTPHSGLLATSAGTTSIRRLTDGVLSAGIGVDSFAILHFAGDSAGAELWRSNGFTGGTFRLTDINPGSVPSPIAYLTRLGSIVFFTAQSPVVGTELWKTDGTPFGTTMVKDINPDGSSTPRGLTAVGNQIMFSANNGTAGVEIWKSDGTSGGTQIVRDIILGGTSGVNEVLGEASGRFYFRATNRLWVSDGSFAGTFKVLGPNGSLDGVRGAVAVAGVAGGTLIASSAISNIDSTPSLLLHAITSDTASRITKADYLGNAFELTRPVVYQQSAFFRMFAAGGLQLARSNGTQPDTLPVNPPTNFTAPADPELLGTIGNKVLFLARSPDYGKELWISNGAQDGTLLVQDINPGPADLSIYQNFGTGSGKLVFNASSQGLEGIWVSDGTADHTRRILASTALDVYDGVVFNNQLYVYGLDSSDISGLFRVNLETGDFNLISSIGEFGPDEMSDFKAGSSLFYFFASDGEHGLEPWRSDGTPGGTFMLGDTVPGENGPAFGDVNIQDDQLVYSTSESNGFAIKGTDSLNRSIRNITTFPNAESLSVSRSPAGLLFLSINGADSSDLTLIRPGQSAQRICSNCGISAISDAMMLSGSLKALMAFGEEEFSLGTIFIAPNQSGVPRGIPLDIKSFDPVLTALGEGAVFMADSDSHGAELWFTDGTTNGTRMISDIYEGPLGSDISNLTPIEAAVLFSANDGVHGNELYITATGLDLCPSDPSKLTPGICGCGVADLDLNANGVIDCSETSILSAPKPAKVRVDRQGRVRLVLEDKVGVTYKVRIKSLSSPKTKPIVQTSTNFRVTVKKVKPGRYSVTYKYALANSSRESPASKATKFKK